METNQLKNTIQDFAIEKWLSKDKVGTIETPMKGERTFIFLKALYKMPKDNRKTIHLFLSDSMTREKDALYEIEKFDEIFDVDVFRDYNLQFFSYESVADWEGRSFGLVCCDKFHEQLTPGNFKFHLNNKYEAILGVTNAINKYSFFSIKMAPMMSAYFGKMLISKEDMILKTAPICFKYNIRGNYNLPIPEKKKPLNIFVIKNKLDERNCIMKHETPKSLIYLTEKQAYDSVIAELSRVMLKIPEEGADLFEFEEEKLSDIKKLLNKRNKILNNLSSKKTLVEGLLFRLRGRTMLYGNHLQSLEVLAPGKTISMKNTDERNALIKRTFEKGNLRVIATHQDVKGPVKLNFADNCVFKDFYGSQEDFLEKVNGLRDDFDKNGNVFIVVTEGTQEVVWFNEMVKDLGEHNYILCDSLISVFNEYSKIEDN